MRIGVIVTVYNLEKFVRQSLLSVFSQNVTPDRVVVVNDGSTDRSLDIIREFSDQVEIINHEKNCGVLPSVISGLRLLDNVDIIAFLDGDDVWMPTKLAEISKAFLSSPDILLVTHFYQWMDGEGTVLSVVDDTMHNLRRIEQEAGSDIIARSERLKSSILGYKGVWLGSAFSIRRQHLNIDAFEEWSKGLWGHHLSHQDQPLAAFLIYTNQKGIILYLPSVLFHYRVFGENSSGNTKTLVKAMRTLSRSKATLIRSENLLRKMIGRSGELARVEQKIEEVEFLESLYNRRFKTAAFIFVRLIKYFMNSRRFMKETVRLAGVLILGPDRFLRMKTLK